jgi:hypothetical protein
MPGCRSCGLPDLENVNLESTRGTDAGLSQLNRLKRLCDLSLNRTAATDAGLVDLMAGASEANRFEAMQSKNATVRASVELISVVTSVIANIESSRSTVERRRQSCVPTCPPCRQSNP